MAGNRKAAEEYVLAYLKDILKSDSNAHIYHYFFGRMNDKQFDEFIQAVKEGRASLVIEIPNGSKECNQITFQHILNIADKRGVRLYKRIVVPETDTTPSFTSPNTYFAGYGPVKRQIQTIGKGLAVPKISTVTDLLTGQPAGPSKKSAISAHEAAVINSAGLRESLHELYNIRGGDSDAYAAFRASITKTGAVNNNAIEPYRTGAKSTKTLNVYYKGMHISSTLES